jgi:hypothetical protein
LQILQQSSPSHPLSLQILQCKSPNSSRDAVAEAATRLGLRIGFADEGWATATRFEPDGRLAQLRKSPIF